MGLFDFFKKKDTPQENDLYTLISRYNEYIAGFITNHQSGNLSPIAAYQKSDGEIVGFLYINGDDDSYTLMADEVVTRMKDRFERELAGDIITSYVVMFHLDYQEGDAGTTGVMTVAYHFKDGPEGQLEAPYTIKGENVSMQFGWGFTNEQNDIILKTKLVEGKQYFKDVEKITPPVIPNEAGLKVTRSNTLNLSDMWSGVMGHASYTQGNASSKLREYFAYGVMNSKAVKAGSDTKVGDVLFDDTLFRIVIESGKVLTAIPVVKTDYVIDVVNTEINEWENCRNMEAVLRAKGRDTFGLLYFATDYAKNREIYLSRTNLNIKVSGIVNKLDLFKPDPNGELQYSDEFTGYMPVTGFENMAIIDFIGEVEDFRETQLLNDGSVKGYIMKVRMITHNEVKDFFTIDMFVNPENMEFGEMKKGLKVHGIVTMQGEIAE